MKVFHSIDLDRNLPDAGLADTLPFTARVISAYDIQRVWTKYDGLGRSPSLMRAQRYRNANGLDTGRGQIVCLDDEFNNDLHYGTVDDRQQRWTIEQRRLTAALRMTRESMPNARVGLWNIPTRRQAVNGVTHDTLVPAQDILFPSFYDLWPEVNNEPTMRRWASDHLALGKPVIPYVGLQQPVGDGVHRLVPMLEFMQIIRGAAAAEHEGKRIEGLCLWLPLKHSIERWGLWADAARADHEIGMYLLVMVGLVSAAIQQQ